MCTHRSSLVFFSFSTFFVIAESVFLQRTNGNIRSPRLVVLHIQTKTTAMLQKDDAQCETAAIDERYELSPPPQSYCAFTTHTLDEEEKKLSKNDDFFELHLSGGESSETLEAISKKMMKLIE